MSENERYQFIILHHPGSLPGLPGSHAPGPYVIDWQERTLHEARSLEAYLASLTEDAPVEAPEGQETAQQEDEANIPPLPEMPAMTSVAMPETGVVPSAQPDEGTNAPEPRAPMAVGGNEQTESSASEGA